MSAPQRMLLDRDTADRLLSGLVLPDDAPPGYAAAAALVAAAGRLQPSPSRAEDIVRSMRAVLAPLPTVRRTRPRRIRRNLAVLGLAAMGAGMTSVAIASTPAVDLLPTPLRRVLVPSSVDPTPPEPVRAPAAPEKTRPVQRPHSVPTRSDPPQTEAEVILGTPTAANPASTDLGATDAAPPLQPAPDTTDRSAPAETSVSPPPASSETEERDQPCPGQRRDTKPADVECQPGTRGQREKQR